MFALMLFAISIVALTQFGLYYWRAVLASAASQQVSDGILKAAGVENGRVTGDDFQTLAGLHDLTPVLHQSATGLGFVRLYYRIVDSLSAVAGQHMPTFSGWCDKELAVCARYVAVQIDRRLQANMELAAALRSC